MNSRTAVKVATKVGKALAVGTVKVVVAVGLNIAFDAAWDKAENAIKNRNKVKVIEVFD